MPNTLFVKYKILAIVAILIILFFSRICLLGQLDPAKQTKLLLKKYQNSIDDSTKIKNLFEIASFYHNYLENEIAADSVSQIALQIAQQSHKTNLILNSYNKYIECNNIFIYHKQALNYGLLAEKLAQQSNDPQQIINTYNNIVTLYLSKYEFDKALEYSYKCLSYSSTIEDQNFKVISFLNIGKSLTGKNQKIEAFRNYLNAYNIAEKINNKALQRACCDNISDFYNLSKIYIKAIEYKLKERDIIRSMNPNDSVSLMFIEQDLQEIDINSNNNQVNEVNIKKVLDFSVRWKHQRMFTVQIALIRQHLIVANKMGELRDLYYVQYPFLLSDIKTRRPGQFNLLQAYFKEYENKPDSALAYFSNAESILQSEPNKLMLSNFYFRYGQFLKRHNLKVLAIDKFTKSYELASQASYFDYMINAAKQLESLYVINGDFKKAYDYSILNMSLNDSLNNLLKKDQMLALEIDHETELRNQKAEQEKLATLRRYSIQYTGIIILMIIVFIILLLLGSLRVPIWIIKMLGFFAFIFFFEFLIMILDNKIHHLTHGEPWKILLIKIFLIAILLPLHHFVEKRVVSFLINPNMINIFHYPFKAKVREKINKMIGKES